MRKLNKRVESLKTFAINFEISPFYGSKPVGPQDQPDYVNAVAKFDTDLTALELLDKLQSIENAPRKSANSPLGRTYAGFGYYLIRR
ncbi:2-amino-4-hydroxy-6-hydroxymethyldihydropteridinepyrophosphokinase [Actinobacillus pleuropneumoniae]|nr:2-amino-4-hydroxy-6-hydroxymethyldihydropteridinepyrophosphokinase [Actinobacillus pleuropneumoniae]